MLSNHIYAAEAELRWLDEVEETVTRAKLQTGKAPKPASSTTADNLVRSAR